MTQDLWGAVESQGNSRDQSLPRGGYALVEIEGHSEQTHKIHTYRVAPLDGWWALRDGVGAQTRRWEPCTVWGICIPVGD